MKNKFLLMKCISLGALSFPTPFLVFFYVLNMFPDADLFARLITVIFLLLSGGLIGVTSYYKDTSIEAMKDWFPSSKPQR